MWVMRHILCDGIDFPVCFGGWNNSIICLSVRMKFLVIFLVLFTTASGDEFRHDVDHVRELRKNKDGFTNYVPDAKHSVDHNVVVVEHDNYITHPKYSVDHKNNNNHHDAPKNSHKFTQISDKFQRHNTENHHDAPKKLHKFTKVSDKLQRHNTENIHTINTSHHQIKNTNKLSRQRDTFHNKIPKWFNTGRYASQLSKWSKFNNLRDVIDAFQRKNSKHFDTMSYAFNPHINWDKFNKQIDNFISSDLNRDLLKDTIKIPDFVPAKHFDINTSKRSKDFIHRSMKEFQTFFDQFIDGFDGKQSSIDSQNTHKNLKSRSRFKRHKRQADNSIVDNSNNTTVDANVNNSSVKTTTVSLTEVKQTSKGNNLVIDDGLTSAKTLSTTTTPNNTKTVNIGYSTVEKPGSNATEQQITVILNSGSTKIKDVVNTNATTTQTTTQKTTNISQTLQTTTKSPVTNINTTVSTTPQTTKPNNETTGNLNTTKSGNRTTFSPQTTHRVASHVPNTTVNYPTYPAMTTNGPNVGQNKSDNTNDPQLATTTTPRIVNYSPVTNHTEITNKATVVTRSTIVNTTQSSGQSGTATKAEPTPSLPGALANDSAVPEPEPEPEPSTNSTTTRPEPEPSPTAEPTPEPGNSTTVRPEPEFSVVVNSTKIKPEPEISVTVKPEPENPTPEFNPNITKPEPEFSTVVLPHTSNITTSKPEPEISVAPKPEPESPTPELTPNITTSEPQAEFSTPEPRANTTSKPEPEISIAVKPEPEISPNLTTSEPQAEISTPKSIPEPEVSPTSKPEPEISTAEVSPVNSSSEPQPEISPNITTPKTLAEYSTAEPSRDNTTEIPEPETEIPIAEVTSSSKPEPTRAKPEPNTTSEPIPKAETTLTKREPNATYPEPHTEPSAEPNGTLSVSEPVNLVSKPASEPTTPEPSKPEPTASVSEPSKPVSEPSKPVSEPTKPVSEPSTPVSEPTKPTSEPTKSIPEPHSTAEPHVPTSEPTPKSHEPSAEPTSEPVKTSPEPRSEPSKPTPEPSKPTPEPSKPTPEPSKPSSEPHKPTSEPHNRTTSEPEPHNKTNPEPTSEPGSVSPEPSSEPGSVSPEPEPIGEPTPFSEPIPDWLLAKSQWKEAWHFHLYFVGVSFALLAFYCLISVIRLWRMKQLFSKAYFVTLNLLICFFALLRTAYMFIDGYNSHNTIPTAANYFLYSIGFPTITSAFSILFYALLQATQMRLLPPRVQRIKILIGIIVIHYVISILTDFVVGFFYSAKIMLILCEVVSIVWGLFLVFAFFYIFRSLYVSAQKRQEVVEQLSSLHRNAYMQYDKKEKVPKYTLSLAVKVTFATSVFGIFYVGLHVYGLVGVYNIYSHEKPKPWPWWTFHFCLRLIELAMCWTMAYVATQPFRYLRSEKQSSCFCYLPCWNIVRPEKYDKNIESIQWDKLDKNLVYKSSCKQSEKNNSQGVTAKFLHKSLFLPEMRRLNNEMSKNSANIYSVNGRTNLGADENESRPTSMLVIENGYIRFRSDAELMGNVKTNSSYESMNNGADNRVIDNRNSNSDYQVNEFSLDNSQHPLYCNVDKNGRVKENDVMMETFNLKNQNQANLTNISPQLRKNLSNVSPLFRNSAYTDIELYGGESLSGSITSFAPITANFSMSIENEIQRRMTNNTPWGKSKSNISVESSSCENANSNWKFKKSNPSVKSYENNDRHLYELKNRDKTPGVRTDNVVYTQINKDVRDSNDVLTDLSEKGLLDNVSESPMSTLKNTNGHYNLARSRSEDACGKNRIRTREISNSNVRYFSLTDLEFAQNDDSDTESGGVSSDQMSDDGLYEHFDMKQSRNSNDTLRERYTKNSYL